MTIGEGGEILFNKKEVEWIVTKSFFKTLFYGFIGGFIFAYMIFSILH